MTMKRSILPLFLLMIFQVTANSQMLKDTVFTYGVDLKPAYKKIAFIEKVRFTSDSSYTCILFDAKTNVIRRKLYYANEIPSAPWEYYDENGNLTSTRNYVPDEIKIPKIYSAKSECMDSITIHGLAQEFNNYVVRNIMYPQLAVENNVQGKVIYKFWVDRAGKMTRLAILKSSSRFLTEEAIRLMTTGVPESLIKKISSPNCDASYTMPMVFKIQQ